MLAKDHTQWKIFIEKGVDTAENKIRVKILKQHRKHSSKPPLPQASLPPAYMLSKGKQCLSKISLYSHYSKINERYHHLGWIVAVRDTPIRIIDKSFLSTR